MDPRYPQLPMTQGNWSGTLSGLFGNPPQQPSGTDFVPTPPVRPTPTTTQPVSPASVPTPPVRPADLNGSPIMDSLYNGTQEHQYPLNYDSMGNAPGNTGPNPYALTTMPYNPHIQQPSRPITPTPVAKSYDPLSSIRVPLDTGMTIKALLSKAYAA